MNIEAFASKGDLLGMLAFLYIVIYAIKALNKEKNIMNWILLIVGMGGLLVDLFVVINTYF